MPTLKVKELHTFSNELLLETYESKFKEIADRSGGGVRISNTILNDIAKLKREILSRMISK